jgi:hypothetical protein
MARFSQPRSAFGPEALAQLKPIFDDVWKELVSEAACFRRRKHADAVGV